MAIDIRSDVISGRPSISVVIPVHNGAVTIGRALDSVLAQTYPPHETIVVDDGSSDDTEVIVSGYGTAVRYLCQENSGPAMARNRGVELASGDWIAFLDADDWYYPDRLRLHAELIAARPDLDFLVGNFDYRGPDGRLLRHSMDATELGRLLLTRFGESGAGVIEGPEIGAYITQQFSDTRTLTLPRETFRGLGGFPTGFRICEDVVFLLRLCARGRRIGVTCAPSAVYLVHDDGLIRSDRYRAQTETIRALRSVGAEMNYAPTCIRAAWRGLVKRAYDDLGWYLAKSGRRFAAARSFLRSFLFRPALVDLRHMASVILG